MNTPFMPIYKWNLKRYLQLFYINIYVFEWNKGIFNWLKIHTIQPKISSHNWIYMLKKAFHTDLKYPKSGAASENNKESHDLQIIANFLWKQFSQMSPSPIHKQREKKKEN